MAQKFYRFYLYAVFTAFMIFLAVAFGTMLSVLLRFTPLRGEYGSIPAQAEVIQVVSFASIALIIGGILAGVHYWLIRRDLRNNPSAGDSAIRAFFLNITEGLGVVLAVPTMGFMVFDSLARDFSAAGGAAIALPTLALVALFEGERRRTTVTSGAALAFQRVHL
jgi:hypothetical protein